MSVDCLEDGCTFVQGQDGEEVGEQDMAQVREHQSGTSSTPEDSRIAPPSFDVSPVGVGSRYPGEGSRFRFLSGVRNINGGGADWATPVPPEPAPRTSAKWKASKVKIIKYVDDGVQLEKLNMETALRLERDGKQVRVKQAVQTQNTFKYVTRRAESIGMKVNSNKTSVLCISDALSFTAEGFIEDGGLRLTSGDSMKLLGFHFSAQPTVSAHLMALRRRFRSRYWVLRHLRSAGFTNEELVRVYKVVVRPVACLLYTSPSPRDS